MSSQRFNSNHAPQEGREVIAGSSLEDTGQAFHSTNSNHPTKVNSEASIPEVDASSGKNNSSQAETGSINTKHRTSSVFQSWLLELLSLLVSLTSFGAITAILSKYDQEVQPEFTHNININTLIAILSTILRATLLYTLSQVIGQAKWVWMAESSRPLRDVERFDEAGKGAWGSLKFFSPKRNHTPTLVSSLVVIASYAIGPFSQQASSPYPCNQVVGEAKLLVAAHVDIGKTVPPDMAAAVMTGMRYGDTNISLSISNLFECKSGNCTFPSTMSGTHTTIGICNACADITEAVEKADNGEDGTDYFTTHSGSIAVTWPSRTKEAKSRVLMILTAYLLMDEIIQCHRDHSKNPVWKSAILPLVVYNVKPKAARTGSTVKTDTEETVPLLDLTQLEKLAESMVVRFVKDRNSPGFVIEENAEAGAKEKGPRPQEA
ncbi:hypothetical protein CcaCcLH18_08394 [Colletotrichum camelliae]|nr:hypothetical protein CcaCcLH18_08394 [Colletotrichum camelliae]